MAFRPHLNDYQSVGDPVITADWYMLIPFIPGAPDPRRISYKINSTALPGTQIEQVLLELGARKWAFGGRRVYQNSWTATLVETSDGSSRADLIRWMDMCRPYRNGVGSYKSQYGVDAELYVYDAANRISVMQIVKGLWPMQLDDASLDQGGSTPLQYSIQFSYDEVVEHYNIA